MEESRLEQRWGFLAPWFSGLRWSRHYRFPVQGVFELDPHHMVEVCFLDSSDHSENKAEFRRMRDAVALLAAVERADPAALKFLLETYCDVRFDWGVGELLHPFQYSLRTDRPGNRLYQARFPENLVELCGMTQQEDASPEYLEALDRIAALDERLQDEVAGVEIQVPVFLTFELVAVVQHKGPEALDEISKAVLAVLEVVRLLRAQRGNCHHTTVARGKYRCSFVVELIDVQLCAPMLNETSLRAVCELMDESMWPLNLNVVIGFGGSSVRSMRSRFGRFLADLFTQRHIADERRKPWPDTTSSCSSGQSNTVELLFAESTTRDDLAAFFSAVALNQTVKKLVIRLRQRNNAWFLFQELWKWLAYAVFSERARTHSALESLELFGLHSMSSEDVESFAAILASDHPEEDLFGVARGLVEERDATLRSGAPIRWNFNKSGRPKRGSKPLTSESVTYHVRTFGDDGVSEWVDALLPGLGRCQVRREDLTLDDATAEGCTMRGLRELQIVFSSVEAQTAYNGVPLFLEMVGFSLHSLILQDVGNLDIAKPEASRQLGQLDKNWILRSCPNLRRLYLFEGPVVEAVLNFEEYHKTRQPLPALDLLWGNNAMPVVKELADPSNPLSKCMHRIHVRETFIDHMDGYTSPDLVRSILEMFDTNQTMEHFQIDGLPRLEPYRDQVTKHHLKPIRRIREPLPTVAKLALMSVMASQRRSETSYSKRQKFCAQLPDLNQSVLMNIFVYAAYPVIRQVNFRG